MADGGDGPFLSAAECARRTGLTVRALRVYERHGLVRPRRTAAGWRVYGPADLRRLGAVTALRAIGLSLRQIGTVLKPDAPPLDRLLTLRAEAWRHQLAAARRGLAATLAAQETLRQPTPPDLDTLCTLIRSLVMETMPKPLQEVMDDLYTPEEQAAWIARKSGIPQAEKEAVEAAWPPLLRDVQALVDAGTDPAAPEARALLERWRALTERFTQDDPEEAAKVAQLWTRYLERDPDGQQLTDLPLTQAVWTFMKQVAEAEKARLTP